MKTALEVIVQTMITEGWATKSDGEVDAPTGAFAYMSNSESEVFGTPGGIREAFEDDEAVKAYAPTDDDWQQLVGHLVIREDSDGNVHVTRYTNVHLMREAYDDLELAYSKFLAPID